MAAAHLQKFRADITKKLHEPSPMSNIFAAIEQRTGVDRFYVVAAVSSLFALYLIFGYCAELLCNTIGFLYPAYMSIKAIESASKDDDTQWLTYWVIFALFNVVEFAVDTILSWFPIYWLCKCVLMVYLHLPMTNGARTLYVGHVRPFYLKYQPLIDSRLGKFMDKKIDAAVENDVDKLHEN